MILLPFLNAMPLIDPDEPVYGQTAREMLEAGDWLSPRIYGEFWYDKPPLFYWLEMMSYSLGGISSFTSRLPSALLGMATVGFLYHEGKEMFNKDIAFFSASILVTMLGFLYIGKAAITDMTLVFTLTVAMVSFYRQKYYRAYIFCGLALLAKGPVGYAFPALIMLLYIILCRHWHLLREMKIPQGIVLAFAVGLPWYFLMYQAHGDAFLDTFIGYHNITRFAAPEHPGRNSIFLYIPIFLGAILPWTPAIFPALYRLKKKRDPFKDALLFCLIWAAFIFVFFSLSKTQLVTYIAPMFPPVAYILGWYGYRCRIEGHTPHVVLATALLLGFVMLACNFIPLHENDQFYRIAIHWGSVILACALCLPAFLLWKRHGWAAFFATAITMAVFAWASFAFILPKFENHITSKNAVAVLENAYDDRSPLYIEKFLRPGYAFYGRYYGQEWDETKDMDFTALRHDEKTYIVMTKRAFYKLAKTQPVIEDFGIAAQTPTQVILINHP